jgi:hypothetical protein
MTKRKFFKTIRIVSRECNIRYFTYEAHVCTTTGRLLIIQAGCRRWQTFDRADAHYGTDTIIPLARHWTDDHIFGADNIRNDQLRRFAERLEARVLLRRLREDTEAVQARIRRRRKS